MNKPVLDDIDYRILAKLQVDNRISNQDLAEEVGLSPPACLRRVRVLREDGVIERDVSILDPKKLGPSVWMLVLIECERERNHLMDELKRTLTGQPEVLQCFVVTGPADFAVLVVTRDVEHYDLFAEKFFRSNNNIRRFETMVIISRVKTTLSLPI